MNLQILINTLTNTLFEFILLPKIRFDFYDHSIIFKYIKVFPILVGKGGLVSYPVGHDIFGQMQYRKVEIRTNPELLKTIATESKGKFYRAVDEQALEEDFQDILDHMEKSRLMDPGRFTRSTEVFQLALLPALLAILLELTLSWTRFRRFP